MLAFDGDGAEEAANLRLATKASGLSLGDRACLAWRLPGNWTYRR